MLLGIVLGVIGTLLVAAVVAAPLVLAHRTDLPLERKYGSGAISIAARLMAGNQANPRANDQRAVFAGREAYTGSCAQCHGATGDGHGVFGLATYPPATDLRAEDTQEKTDAQLFWIIKNGLSFTGMPGFGGQYNDQAIWALVDYVRALANGQQESGGTGGTGGQSGAQPGAAQPAGGQPGQAQVGGGERRQGEAGGQGGPVGGRGAIGPIAVPTATGDQLAQAQPFGDQVQHGAAVYFAQACDSCHGPVGNAPGDLALGGRSREAQEAIRGGRPGMPAYGPSSISDQDMAALTAYMNTFPASARGFGGEREGGEGGGREGGQRPEPGISQPGSFRPTVGG